MRRHHLIIGLGGLAPALILAVGGARRDNPGHDSNRVSPAHQELKFQKGSEDEPNVLDEEGLPQHIGRYSNHFYSFSLTIPAGLVGYSAPDPAPEHGVAIVLSKEPKTWVYAGAHYNATFLESLDDVVDQHLEWVSERGTSVELLRRVPTFLGNLPAIRFAALYEIGKTEKTTVEEEVVAFRSFGEDKNGVIYNTTLYTTEDRYNDDARAFERILLGWKATPMRAVKQPRASASPGTNTFTIGSNNAHRKTSAHSKFHPDS